jgi:hypothetical protein
VPRTAAETARGAPSGAGRGTATYSILDREIALESDNIFSSGSPGSLKNERRIETALVTMEKNNIEAQGPCYEGGRERERLGRVVK